MAPNAIAKKYTLTGGENTYSSPASVNEADARKLQSLIPSLSGALERERPTIPFTADAAFASRVGAFHQFKRNNSGTIVTYWFCATATVLYQLSGFPSGVWNAVAAVGTLAGFPVFSNINNTLHMSDGVTNWIFDGASWVTDGLPIPTIAPEVVVASAAAGNAITAITRSGNVVSATLTGVLPFSPGTVVVVAGVTDTTYNGTFQIVTVSTSLGIVTWNQRGPDSSSSSGTVTENTFTILSNRYYWTTFFDGSATHPHESSSSPTSVGTGATTSKIVKVHQQPGTLSSISGTAVVGTGTSFSQAHVGMNLFGPNNGPVSNFIGKIASVTDSLHLTLVATAASAITGNYVIVPTRATGWNVYASSSEEDRLGSLIGIVSTGFAEFIDTSPMIGTLGAAFQNVQRPLLNDPTPPSTMMEVHKNRIWRNLPTTFPNFFTYTGFEEILAEQAGTPSECVPGAASNTVSPGQINETSFPDQSSVITGIRKHGDSLYIGTELNVIPLYGSSLADFQLSESQAFAVGFAGRRASCSTPFGLAFVSYDLKVYLYPSQYSFGVDSTTALVELGRPKRPEFENIDGNDFPNMHLIFYNWGRRNWLVLSYRRTDLTFATWVFDFEVKGWFQLQQGYTAIAVFEMTLGRKSLIAATTGNKVVVIDDLTGNFPIPGGTVYPVGYLRVLLDFTDPGSNFAGRNIEFEKSNDQMGVDVTIWLDPVDPENPGQGIPIPMTKKKLGANAYTGRPNPSTGSSCQRVLVEFAVAASAQNGFFRGYTVEADKLPASPVL
jgi:hypothetical protein